MVKDFAHRDTAASRKDSARKGRGKAAPKRGGGNRGQRDDHGRAPAGPAPSSGSASPRLLTFVTGVATGLFIAFLVDIGLPGLPAAITGNGAAAPAAASAPPGPAPVVDQGQPGGTAQGPRYEFYDMLAQPALVVPVVEGAGTAAAEPSAPIVLLQAGSFRKPEDAEALRAALLLQGLDVQTRAVTLANGDTWHRVLVGPFNTARDLRRARTALRERDIDAIPLQPRLNG